MTLSVFFKFLDLQVRYTRSYMMGWVAASGRSKSPRGDGASLRTRSQPVPEGPVRSLGPELAASTYGSEPEFIQTKETEVGGWTSASGTSPESDQGPSASSQAHSVPVPPTPPPATKATQPVNWAFPDVRQPHDATQPTHPPPKAVPTQTFRADIGTPSSSQQGQVNQGPTPAPQPTQYQPSYCGSQQFWAGPGNTQAAGHGQPVFDQQDQTMFDRIVPPMEAVAPADLQNVSGCTITSPPPQQQQQQQRPMNPGAQEWVPGMQQQTYAPVNFGQPNQGR